MNIEPVLRFVRLCRRTVIATLHHLGSLATSLAAATGIAIVAGLVGSYVAPAAATACFYCAFSAVLTTTWLAIGTFIVQEVNETR